MFSEKQSLCVTTHMSIIIRLRSNKWMKLNIWSLSGEGYDAEQFGKKTYKITEDF